MRNYAKEQSSSVLIGCLREIQKTVYSNGGRVDAETAKKIFSTTLQRAVEPIEENFASLVRSLSTAMECYVIAHEAGHIALGHTLGRETSFEISRNQEREADSFASSCLSASPFRDHLFLGQIFTLIMFVWRASASTSEPTTHPHSVERFYNALKSNSAAAKEAAERFGLSADLLKQLLPDR
jgi:hypothetical protein